MGLSPLGDTVPSELYRATTMAANRRFQTVLHRSGGLQADKPLNLLIFRLVMQHKALRTLLFSGLPVVGLIAFFI